MATSNRLQGLREQIRSNSALLFSKEGEFVLVPLDIVTVLSAKGYHAAVVHGKRPRRKIAAQGNAGVSPEEALTNLLEVLSKRLGIWFASHKIETDLDLGETDVEAVDESLTPRSLSTRRAERLDCGQQ